MSDSYLDRKADFTRDLADRLDGVGAAALAERTGLLDVTARALLTGHGELMSWEVVSACLAAAGVAGDEVRDVRARWTAAEQALWERCGGDLVAAFEQNPRTKPAKIAEAFQSEVPWRRLTSRYPPAFEPWAVPSLTGERRLPDPSAANDIRDFYRLLAELKVWAGSPRQSEIERRSWGALPDATVSAMLQRDRWRGANERERARVGRFAAACGLPGTEIARWTAAYERLRHVPPPDDLAHARAEGEELRRLLAEARTEAEDLRLRLDRAGADGAHTGEARIDAERIDEARVDAERIDEVRIDAARIDAARTGGDRVGDLSAAPPGPSPHAPAPDRRGEQPVPRGLPGPRGFRWPRERAAVSAVAAVALFAAGAVTGALSTLSARGVAQGETSLCFRGTLHLIGSTAFEETAVRLARRYEELCRDAHVAVNSAGSNEGVRTLGAGEAGSTIVMHDGYLKPDSDQVRFWGLHGFPVAVVSFAVIVNRDVNLTGLTVRDLRAIYSPGKGPVSWATLHAGPVPIRLIGRTDGSGTRVIFEEQVLGRPEPELSSDDCVRRDALHAAALIVRCERSSQRQVLEVVGRVPGAIGYAEAHAAADRVRHPGVRVVALDGGRPDAGPSPGPGTQGGPLPGGYPFMAPEVFYTYGFPANGSPASAFLTFLGHDAAGEQLREAGLPSCVRPATAFAAVCRPR